MQRRYVVRGEEVASRVDVAAYGQDEFVLRTHVLRTQVCVEYNATLVYTHYARKVQMSRMQRVKYRTVV